LLLLVLGLFSLRGKDSKRGFFKKLASSMNLNYSEEGGLDNPKISGVFRNRNILINLKYGAENQKTIELLQVHISHKALLPGNMAVLYRDEVNHLTEKIGELKEVNINSSDFEKRFIVQGWGEDSRINQVLSLGLQQALLTLDNPLIITKNEVYFHNIPDIDLDIILNEIRILYDLAGNLDKIFP